MYVAVVLYFRAGPIIGSTVRGLLNQTLPPCEIIVVDNASHDRDLDEWLPIHESIRVLRLSENVGYAAGMNAGFSTRTSDAPFVLFLTHEVEMDADCVGRLHDAAI